MPRKRTSRASFTPAPSRVMLRPLPSLRLSALSRFQMLEDRRRWHPERAHRPALSFRPRAARLVVPPSRGAMGGHAPRAWHKVGFKHPKSVAICIRRKDRREVLFATGKGGGKVSRRRRRNNFSDVRC